MLVYLPRHQLFSEFSEEKIENENL